jgi:hypothetical protein
VFLERESLCSTSMVASPRRVCQTMGDEPPLHPGVPGRAAQDSRQQRYQSLDQAWVNWREQRLLTRLLTQCQWVTCTVLDVPWRLWPVCAAVCPPGDHRHWG